MKKILAIILAVAMMATMLAVSVSAAKEVGGENGITPDAWTSPTTTPGQDLKVKVADVTHKYAVDLTFAFDSLVIGGDIKWNVNTMKYNVEGRTLADTTKTIAVSNRSDLPVYAYAAATDVDAADGITITSANTETSKLEVAKATRGTTANGTATVGTLNISVTSTNWDDVAAYYAEKKLANEIQEEWTIASVTVTISKDN